MPVHLKMYCIWNEFSRMQKFAFYSAAVYILAGVLYKGVLATTQMKGTKFLVWSTVDRTRNSTFTDTKEIWGAY